MDGNVQVIFPVLNMTNNRTNLDVVHDIHSYFVTSTWFYNWVVHKAMFSFRSAASTCTLVARSGLLTWLNTENHNIMNNVYIYWGLLNGHAYSKYKKTNTVSRNYGTKKVTHCRNEDITLHFLHTAVIISLAFSWSYYHSHFQTNTTHDRKLRPTWKYSDVFITSTQFPKSVWIQTTSICSWIQIEVGKMQGLIPLAFGWSLFLGSGVKCPSWRNQPQS